MPMPTATAGAIHTLSAHLTNSCTPGGRGTVGAGPQPASAGSTLRNGWPAVLFLFTGLQRRGTAKPNRKALFQPTMHSVAHSSNTAKQLPDSAQAQRCRCPQRNLEETYGSGHLEQTPMREQMRVARYHTWYPQSLKTPLRVPPPSQMEEDVAG
jgi:hypothetical protein